MTALIKKLYASDVVRYVFFGGCTTLVNLVSFFLLRQAGVQRDLANVISIILAILFAYVVNSKFVGARGVTMAIEVAGVWFFAEIIHMNDMAGKFITQFVVLALNYIFSKFLVFTSGRKS